MRYAFIEAHVGQYSVHRLCKAVAVHPNSYYAWQMQPLSPRVKGDQHLLELLKQTWLGSGGVYGYRRLILDMRNLSECRGKYRVARLLKAEGLRSQSGYRRRPAGRASKSTVVAPNHLQRQFTVGTPNQSRVTDITYIRTHKGRLYLSAVIDPWSRMVIGWSVGQRVDTQLALDVLLTALWWRHPHQQMLTHSDRGCQFTNHTWQSFLCEHNPLCSMSRRGNYHDNAVAGDFFQLLKRKRVRRQIYATQQEAKSDVFNYIEMFYNPA